MVANTASKYASLATDKLTEGGKDDFDGTIIGMSAKLFKEGQMTEAKPVIEMMIQPDDGSKVVRAIWFAGKSATPHEDGGGFIKAPYVKTDAGLGLKELNAALAASTVKDVSMEDGTLANAVGLNCHFKNLKGEKTDEYPNPKPFLAVVKVNGKGKVPAAATGPVGGATHTASDEVTKELVEKLTEIVAAGPVAAADLSKAVVKAYKGNPNRGEALKLIGSDSFLQSLNDGDDLVFDGSKLELA
jgi:hypothetical protein